LVVLIAFIAPVRAVANDDTSAKIEALEKQIVVVKGGQIQPYHENPWYWEYKGKPLVLIGGTDNDNLFQWTGEKLTEHLDLLVSVGGNYVRNTMSDRDDGDLYAFKQIREGMYDLTKWNEGYRDRLTFFLDETAKRSIIVHLTLWDGVDTGSRWKKHPWNPKNNINLEEGIVQDAKKLFASGPDDDPNILDCKHQYIERLLALTLKYDHIIYNINNESTMSREWEDYWAVFIHRAAKERGRRAQVGSMDFDPSNSVRHALTSPDLYTFVEISQNNQDSRGGRGQAHWENIMFWREKTISSPRPFNNVKIYGAGDATNKSSGSGLEAASRLWKNIFAGCASSRFHRPGWNNGMGLNEHAQINLKAMSILLKELDIFSCSPHNDLLSTRFPVRSAVEAYCTADIGRVYAVYFPAGRYAIDLDPWVYMDELKLRWLDIGKGSWSKEKIVKVQWEGDSKEWGDRGIIRLHTPSNRACVALLETIDGRR
jgi:hypothetical protein